MRKIFYSIVILLVMFFSSQANAQLTPPTLLQPPNNATGVSLFPTFTWTSVSGASYYQLQIFSGPNVIHNASNITTTSYTLTANVLQGNSTYYWRVTAWAGSNSAVSTSFYFTTAPAVPSAPTLSFPQNNATNMPLSFTFDWNDVAGASWYQIQVATDQNFQNKVVDVPGLNNSAYTVLTGILANNMTYYWRVNAGNSGGTSPWSDVWSFSTVPAPPAAPILSYPANGATNIPVNVTLRWFKISNVLNYNVQVSQNSSFTQIVVNEYPTDSLYTIPTGTLSGTTMYYWRVSATNIGGTGPFSETRNFTTAVAPPAAPLLLSPLNNSTGVAISGVLFDWSNSPGANSYRIQIALSSDFGTTFVNTTVTSSQYTHNTPAFAYNTIYYWRVRASNAGGDGVWSQVWSFTTTVATPPAPTLIYPANGATNIPLTPTMDWSDVSGATSYRLQISTSSSFSPLVLNIVVNQSEYLVPSGVLQGYTQYYWRVASINSGGQGSYSASRNFTTVQTFNLNLKVYLEGFYNNTTQTQVIDTVKIYLAQNTSPFTFRDSSLAVLGSDGTANPISFAKASSGNYYIVVKHRNHLETWSAIAMFFSTGNTVQYNFTDFATRAYGSNMKQVGSVWVLYGGDADEDGFIGPFDYDLYKSQFGQWGYKSCDFNGDTFVDGYDLPILNSNFGKSKIRPY